MKRVILFDERSTKCYHAIDCITVGEPMSKKPAKTLDDIARLANVSKSTVSRALNDSPLISRETKERIQSLADEHNFRISATARNLRLRQSRTIAFISPVYYPGFSSAEDLFGLELLSRVGEGLHALGYDLLIVHAGLDDTAWAQAYLDSGRVDGFILVASNRRIDHIRKLVELGAPFVAWGVPLPQFNYCSITGDNVAGGALATQHLIDIGRRRIAFLGGPEDELTVRHRFQGYERALRVAGRAVEPELLAYGNYTHASGITAMQRLLERAPDLDAVFVNSDLMAVGAISAIQDGGRRVPEDVAVVGFDDLSIAVYNNLPLTTIRQNLSLAGRLMAQNLVEHIQTGIVTHETTPVELVVRRSA